MPVTGAFKRTADAANNGLLLTPLLMSYLYNYDPKASFSVRFEDDDFGPRAPDGWFHPSTHPLWTERQLYYYLLASIGEGKMQVEGREYMGTLSIIFGKAVHSFIQEVLGPQQLKLAVPPPPGLCKVCGLTTGYGDGQCREHGIVHPETRSRGHMDGLLDFRNGDGLYGFEFKTSNIMKLQRIQDMDVAAFREKWPDYFGQVQDYMRITGLRKVIVWFLGLGYPWVTREFHIDYDPFYCSEVQTRYIKVIRAFERHTAPLPCCTPGSKVATACPAMACPIKGLNAA